MIQTSHHPYKFCMLRLFWGSFLQPLYYGNHGRHIMALYGTSQSICEKIIRIGTMLKLQLMDYHGNGIQMVSYAMPRLQFVGISMMWKIFWKIWVAILVQCLEGIQGRGYGSYTRQFLVAARLKRIWKRPRRKMKIVVSLITLRKQNIKSVGMKGMEGK